MSVNGKKWSFAKGVVMWIVIQFFFLNSLDMLRSPHPIYHNTLSVHQPNANTTTTTTNTNSRVQCVKLETKGGGPLGLTLAGSEDLNKPITISALIDGGVAQKTGKLKVGDIILAINGETIQGVPLTTATKLLQRFENCVELKICRPGPGELSGIGLEVEL